MLAVKSYSAGQPKYLNQLSKLEVVQVFSRHFYIRIRRAQFTQISADEFQLNSKSAYIPKCIHKCNKIYECTSVDMKAFEDFF